MLRSLLFGTSVALVTAAATGIGSPADAMTPASLNPAMQSVNATDLISCRLRGRLLRGQHYCAHVAAPIAPDAPTEAFDHTRHRYLSRW